MNCSICPGPIPQLNPRASIYGLSSASLTSLDELSPQLLYPNWLIANCVITNGLSVTTLSAILIPPVAALPI